MPDLDSDVIHYQINDYLSSVLPPSDNLLRKMEQYGRERDFPLIGPVAGNLLAMLASMIQASRVFEMGSGFGYSALHIARVLPDDGKIICTDRESSNRDLAHKFFREAGIEDRLDFKVGDAIDLLKEQEGLFDIIVCDIYKEQYPEALELAWPKIRPGGMFIADNLFWHGRVWSGDDQESTRAIHRFTNLIHALPDGRTSIVPIRDGLSITLKIRA